jgi:hypothetical protein
VAGWRQETKVVPEKVDLGPKRAKHYGKLEF